MKKAASCVRRDAAGAIRPATAAGNQSGSGVRNSLRALALCVLLGLGAAAPAFAATHVIIVGAAPPPVRVEHVPAHRRGYVWSAGYWHWSGHRHVWHRGHWVKARHGHHWASPQWEERDGRYYFRHGRWERGG